MTLAMKLITAAKAGRDRTGFKASYFPAKAFAQTAPGEPCDPGSVELC